MNSDKKFDMLIESLVVDAYIKHSKYPLADPLAVRELAIQNSKLRRMLSVKKEDPLAAGLAILSGRSMKKMAKERGKRDKAIGQQHKKVHFLLREFIRANALKLNPNATRSDVRANTTLIENALKDSLSSIKEQLISRAETPGRVRKKA